VGVSACGTENDAFVLISAAGVASNGGRADAQDASEAAGPESEDTRSEASEEFLAEASLRWANIFLLENRLILVPTF